MGARRWSANGALVAAGSLVLTIVGACTSISSAAQRQVERATLVTKPARAVTPADIGVPFTRIWIEHDGRRLEAWAVFGADSVNANSAVFICHGTGETLSDWVYVQRLLRNEGITSFVFDYTGFGNSTGTPTAQALEADAIAAYKSFNALLPTHMRRTALGFSLGSGVLLAAFPRMQPPLDGIIVASAFSTARRAALRRRFFPGILAYLAPDTVWNNVAAIRKVNAPLRIVHSDADRAFPLSMARELARASGQPGSLVIQHGYAHNALYAKATAAQWQPLVRFIVKGS